MKILPVFDRVVVEKIEEPEKTKGGILIPETARILTFMGVVKAVGSGRNIDAPGRIDVFSRGFDDGAREDEPDPELAWQIRIERPPMQVKVGDIVLYGMHSGAEVKVKGEPFFVLREDEILAIIEETEDPAELEAPAEAEAVPELEPAG